jgi:autophagy-related protein 11
VEHGIRVATGSIEPPIRALEKRLAELGVEFRDTADDSALKAKAIDDDLARLADIPALASFGRFFVGHGSAARARRRNTDGDSQAGLTTLATFVDKPSVKLAVSESRSLFGRIGAQIKDFETSLAGLNAQLEELRRGLDISQSRNIVDDQAEPEKLIQEIEVVVDKVQTDYNSVLGLSRDDPKSPANASRYASHHTKHILPGLVEYANEMSELLRRIVEARNAAVVRAADILQMVANIESQQATIKSGVNSLKMSEEEWAIVDKISLASDIPSIYGSLLAEAVRRNEWVEKMRRDSANLAEEVAGYQEEELRRRKKWLKNMRDIIPESFDGAVLSMEINLQGGEESQWPVASRKDLDEYIKAVQGMSGMEEKVSFLTELVQDLDKPTRQQVKRAKAFKNGSVHEAGFGKGSLLLRGEDESRVYKEVITKLEEDLKSNKSRIRKLEDLLHRQSQISRMSSLQSQNGLQETAVPGELDRPFVSSPRTLEPRSRRQSASRRFSSADEKSMARRIVQLEAELNEERTAKAALEKELVEATSTKTDIMENMEAMQREHSEERKSIEDERTKFKIKVEELEDELDRLLGSRDNERTTVERRVDQLVTELEEANRFSTSRIRSLEDQLESQARRHRDELTRREQMDGENREFLSSLITSLAPGTAIPEDSAGLMAQLEEVTQRAVDQATDLARAIALVRSENENIQAALDGQRAEVASLAMKLDSREADITKAHEDLAAQRAKGGSIELQLEEERLHLKALREKFADGETGSEALRRRLAEEESKVTNLSSRLAETRSHNNSLDVELLAMQSRYRSLQGVAQTAASRLESRAQRAKDITQRLYTQNDRLCRLLEALGFVVTHDAKGMQVQRASKVGASSVLPESTAALRSSPSASRKLLEDLSDLSCLLWMEKESSTEEEKKFAEFMEKIDKFNLEALCDAVAKRMRDIEHTARKWQREARAYREKARKAQADAHDKIAFRHFKEGDLALFLPTRNQTRGKPWAAFNVGAPHYFLREQDVHRLGTKEWIVARITKVEERIVDLSKTMNASTHANASDGAAGEDAEPMAASVDDDNPFDLGDGLRWYLLDAQEEKSGAPTTPGLGKSTVAAATVDVTGTTSVRASPSSPTTAGKKRVLLSEDSAVGEASRQLSKSLESRRSSTASKKSVSIATALGIVRPAPGQPAEPAEDSALATSPMPSSPRKPRPSSLGLPHQALQHQQQHGRTPSAASSLRNVIMAPTSAPEADAGVDEVRRDQLFGP